MVYEEILKDKYFVDTYTKIEEIKKDFPVNHGFIHIHNVIENAKNISQVFDLNEEDRELLLVACALHDIGYLVDREDHPAHGAIMAKEYLLSKHWLNDEEIEKVCKTIASHGGKDDEDYVENLSICMILADKMDFSKTRYVNDLVKYPKVAPFLKIEAIRLEKEANRYYVTIYNNVGFNEDELEIDYFKKLNRVLERLNRVKGIEIKIRYVIKNVNQGD